MVVAPGCGVATVGQRQAGASSSDPRAMGTKSYSTLNWEHKYLKVHLPKIGYLSSYYKTQETFDYFKK